MATLLIQEAKSLWNSFYSGAAEWLYPARCALCDGIGLPHVCDLCASEMVPSEEIAVEPPGSPLDFRLAAFRYDGRAAQAVKRLKYERATALAAFMGLAILRVAESKGVAAGRVVVPVPIHWTRWCYRGFNQAALLCEPFGDSVQKAVVRTRSTPPQVGLDLARRQSNLDGAFDAVGAARGQRFLLIDDVVTTGHTARECARALKTAGADEVGIVAFAGES